METEMSDHDSDMTTTENPEGPLATPVSADEASQETADETGSDAADTSGSDGGPADNDSF